MKIVNGELVISEATFDDGYFDSVTFEVTIGDIITLEWIDGPWSSEVSWEILDGTGELLVSGEWGDTLEDDGVLANCEPDFTSDWPTCADGTGNTLELISPDLDNSLPEIAFTSESKVKFKVALSILEKLHVPEG